MTKYLLYLILSISLIGVKAKTLPPEKALTFFGANDPNIQYYGRIDFSDKLKARMWAPGTYFMVRFKGAYMEVTVADEIPGSNNHNYLEIVVDNSTPYRIKLDQKENVIKVPPGLSDGEHTLLICKDTESNIGYIDVIGFKCEQLLPLPAKPKRKIEYFGDSITSGAGMDQSDIPCDKGQWYDEHNAYMSYGALTSRNLDAQWQLTSLAGIGLVHSCCNLKVVMPMVYDKVNVYKDSINWKFKKYQPDVVTVCLGQNDGPQDSTLYCSAYVKLIGNLRQHYPKADIICLSSPMADNTLLPILKRYITAVTYSINNNGDKKVYPFFFSRAYNDGCGGHPSIEQHKLMADELTAFIRQTESW